MNANLTAFLFYMNMLYVYNIYFRTYEYTYLLSS